MNADQFHVVDERVAELPGLHTLAAQGPRGDHLHRENYRIVSTIEHGVAQGGELY